MNRRRNRLFSGLSKQLTSVVSVALVLLILGIVGALAIAARSVTDSIKENLGFNLVMQEDTPQESINRFKQMFNSVEYVSSYEYMSAEEILRQEEMLIGENLIEVIGVNPYQPEFNVKVKAEYASVDSIEKIVSPFKSMPQVADVSVHTEMVREINANIKTMSVVLVAVAAALLLISFVLINNTVRLTIYSRRFLLHTMRLVGATAGFIRRPIVVSNIGNGLAAGVIAVFMLSGIRLYAVGIDPDIDLALSWGDLAFVYAGLIVTGMLICSLAAYVATNKYLRQDYDEMF